MSFGIFVLICSIILFGFINYKDSVKKFSPKDENKESED